MNISSNSLFHFTKEFDTITKILTNKFYGSYCKETLHFKDEKAPLFIPMICFCDIPLKTISHYTNYGKYGIGLSKTWGIKNKLNPVLYLEKNSSIAESLIKSFYGGLETLRLISEMLEDQKNRIQFLTLRNSNANLYIKPKQEIDRLSKLIESLSYNIYSLYFTKHYEDDLEREEGTIKDYRFYDEREWRYIPEFQCAVCELKRTEDEYNQWRKSEKNKPLLNEVFLSFDYKDIDYIIVDRQQEIKNVTEFLKKFNSENNNAYPLEEVLSKVISFEQIEKDF